MWEVWKVKSNDGRSWWVEFNNDHDRIDYGKDCSKIEQVILGKRGKEITRKIAETEKKEILKEVVGRIVLEAI